MRSPRIGNFWTSLAAALAAVLMITSAFWQPVRAAETPLTPEQEAGIREEMAALAQVLVQGGKTPAEAKLAVNAVGVCYGAALTQGLTRQQANPVCGLVLDAFTIQQGTILYTLTADDRNWIATRTTLWTSELAPLLEPDELVAVQSTMSACLEGHIRRGEDRHGAVKQCALGLLPLLNEPELREMLLNAAAKAL